MTANYCMQTKYNDDQITWHEKGLLLKSNVNKHIKLEREPSHETNVNRKRVGLLRYFFVFIFVINRVNAEYTASNNNAEESPIFYEINKSKTLDVSNNNNNHIQHRQQQQKNHSHHHRHHHHQHAHKDNKYTKPAVTERCHLIPSKEQLVFTNYDASSLYIDNDQPKGNNSFHELKRLTRHLPINSRHQSIKRKSNEHFIIYPHYHESFSNLPNDIYKLYKDRLIPEAISYWESSLRVKYPYFPIFLGRICATPQHYYSEATKSVSCESDCASQTKCGDYIQIPEEHLDVCRYCVNGHDCREKGQKYPGINADFILYISSINTEHCNISNTVAFASYCQLESKYNRPVAGYVNICPQSVSSKQSDIHSALATLKHEILHALGFSAGLYAFFLNSDGIPLTARDHRTGKPPFNSQTNMYEPSELVVKTFTRKNWKISDGFIDRNVTMIVTPRVVDEVRMHFNCSSLEGAELEDQGEIGTKFTHWEKRVFENEAMTGTYTQNSVFSRITFAFLEDTGWYTANYSNAEELSWGKDLGCGFSKKSCKSWIDEKRHKGESIRPFCNNIPNVAGNTESKYECNANRDAVLLCNLMRYHHSIPYSYRNFDSSHHQNHLHNDANEFSPSNPIFAYLGGSVVLADYCPFLQQVSWSVSNETIRDSKCSFEENKPDKSKNYVLEEYGKNSKCFLHNRTWQIYSDKCQSRITVSKTIGCYNYKCDPEHGLLVKVNDQYVKCSYKDQVVEFKINSNVQNRNLSVYFGNLVCPSCHDMCKNQIKCPPEQYILPDIKPERPMSFFFAYNLLKNSKESNLLNEQHNECLRIAFNRATSLLNINPFYFIIFIILKILNRIY